MLCLAGHNLHQLEVHVFVFDGQLLLQGRARRGRGPSCRSCCGNLASPFFLYVSFLGACFAAAGGEAQ